jgi:hypothetical protein
MAISDIKSVLDEVAASSSVRPTVPAGPHIASHLGSSSASSNIITLF